MKTIGHNKCPSCITTNTHTSTVGVNDADSQRAVLHVALEVEHGALARRHRHVAQLSCEKRRPDVVKGRCTETPYHILQFFSHPERYTVIQMGDGCKQLIWAYGVVGLWCSQHHKDRKIFATKEPDKATFKNDGWQMLTLQWYNYDLWFVSFVDHNTQTLVKSNKTI